MSLLYKNRMEIKLGEYAVGSDTALVDPLLVTRAQDYRRQIAGRMIPLETEDILKRFPAGEYFTSLKVDGEFDILVFADGECILVNPGGTVRAGLPVLKEAAELLKAAGVKKAILAGELHFAKPGKRARVHDVSRAARQPASQAEVDALSFAPFDIVEIDGAPPAANFSQTWKRLTDIFKKAKRCQVVEMHTCKDGTEIQKKYGAWIEQGAEGAVVRSDSLGLFKIKPRHTLDAVVIGFTEGTEDRQGMIHDLLLALMRPDGCLHMIGHVGGGFSNDDRRGFLSDLKDMIVESDYTEVNDQVAYHMVTPKWVVQISVLDLIAQTTRGLPINKMVLNWDTGKNRYRIVRRLPMVAMISPQFQGRREDKSVNKDDIRMAQVTDIVEVPLADRDARKLQMPQSTLIRREVQTKVMKGQTMVRKLVMWQTNKEKESDDFPAFVLHVTDFSPNRRTPLERDVRVSSSKEQMEELWKELAAECFPKGWTSVTNPPLPAETTTAVAPAKPRKCAKATPSEVDGEPGSEAPAPAPKKKATRKKKDEAES